MRNIGLAIGILALILCFRSHAADPKIEGLFAPVDCSAHTATCQFSAGNDALSAIVQATATGQELELTASVASQEGTIDWEFLRAASVNGKVKFNYFLGTSKTDPQQCWTDTQLLGGITNNSVFCSEYSVACTQASVAFNKFSSFAELEAGSTQFVQFTAVGKKGPASGTLSLTVTDDVNTDTRDYGPVGLEFRINPALEYISKIGHKIKISAKYHVDGFKDAVDTIDLTVKKREPNTHHEHEEF